jgi:hypothetical protein
MIDAELIKKQLIGLEKEISMMEKRFVKGIKKKDRRYSHIYVVQVAKTAYLYGQLEVLKEFDNDDKGGLDYVG